MTDIRTHDLAQAKAARLLKKRTGSVSSALSNGTEHQSRRHKGYAASVSTVSYMDHPHDDDILKQTNQYENSYQLEPFTHFPVAEIGLILENILSSSLADVSYKPDECRKLTKLISDDIKSKVKELDIPRYKIICMVHIGELSNQGLRISSRCLWNAKFDTFSSFEYKNSSLFAVACVYGVYFE
ncbi:dynein light chain Tctex-type 5-B-like [Clavelina lepadiformis]|uniref:Tctex1 domain-containing protein 1 n=1 Tax=Clavelina lepadiformis TaxID=159417 RepID=A0ABP0F9D5_CLALP